MWSRRGSKFKPKSFNNNKNLNPLNKKTGKLLKKQKESQKRKKKTGEKTGKKTGKKTGGAAEKAKGVTVLAQYPDINPKP